MAVRKPAVAISVLAGVVMIAACVGTAAPSPAATVIQPTISAPASTASARPGSSVALAAISPAPSRPPPPCYGRCPAGTHRSTRFQPYLTYTVPEGWFTGDQPDEYVLTVGSDTSNVGIFLFLDPLAHSQQPDCPMVADPTVGTSPKELTDWIASLPGLDATPPKAIVVGGLVGFSLDVRVAPSWTHACPYSDGEPIVPLIVGSSPGSGLDWGVGSMGMRIYVLDAGAGHRVWIDVEGGDGPTYDQLLQRATPVIESFEFSVE